MRRPWPLIVVGVVVIGLVVLAISPAAGIGVAGVAFVAVLYAVPAILLISWAVGIWRLLERILSELAAIRVLLAGDERPPG